MELIGYVTTKGAALSARLLAGATLEITRVCAGSGETALDSPALSHPCQTLATGTPRRSGTTVTLPVTLTAQQAETDYTLREVGVYAQDPDEGEILYRLYRLDQGITIAAGGQLTIRFDLQETLGEAAAITVTGSGAGLLTQADLEAQKGVSGGIAALDSSGLVPPEQLPYTYGTEDLTAGVSPLENGRLHFVYE